MQPNVKMSNESEMYGTAVVFCLWVASVTTVRKRMYQFLRLCPKQCQWTPPTHLYGLGVPK